METLKEIIAKEVKRPKELLTKTKGDIEYIQAFVQALKNEVNSYAKELAGGTLFANDAKKTGARLLDRGKDLQMLFEVLQQTIGEEWNEVREDWPEEYIGHLKEIDDIINRIIKVSLYSYAKLVTEANTSEEVKKKIIPFLERLEKSINDLMRLVSVEETVFDRDVQLAINNHVGKDFKQHAAVYAGEIASRWNNYYRSKWKSTEVVVRGVANDFKRENTLYFPTFTETQLTLFIRFIDHDDKSSKTPPYYIDVIFVYDVTKGCFRMSVEHNSGYNPVGGNGEYNSLNEAFEQLEHWFLRRIRIL